MSKITTDYGLVYSTDGDLCVTKRTDIVPFPGITSYAVETATTNLIGHTNGRFNSVSGGGTTPPTVELVSMKTPWGNEAWKVTIPANNNTGTNGCNVKTNNFTMVANTYYSYFTYVLFEGSSEPSDIIIRPWGTEGLLAMSLDTSKNIGNWQYFSSESVLTHYTGGENFIYYVNDTSTVARTFYIAVGQFEQKPFCSSFVNGSRPAGRFVRPLNLLGFNPATDDWVVHYWKYPVATRTNDLTGYNLCSIGKSTSDNSQGYLWWGKQGGSNVFGIRVVYNDSTSAIASSPSFDPAWYFRNWHHEVLLKHGSEMQYWIDGTLQVQFALAKPLLNNFVVGLTLGGSATAPADNSYIANVCYGLYTDQWTPEFIQEQAAMTQGYYVPPRKVIE